MKVFITFMAGAVLAGGIAVAAPEFGAANRPPKFTKGRCVEFNILDYRLGKVVAATTEVECPRAVDPDGDRVTYAWRASNGTIRGIKGKKLPTAKWTRLIMSGQVVRGTVTLTSRDGRGGSASLRYRP